jgi:hypothetical protein
MGLQWRFRAPIPAVAGVFWCLSVLGAQTLYKYTPDYSGHYFDVRRSPSLDFVFNVAVSTDSPPDGNLIYVGIFSDNRLTEIAALNLKSLDSAGIDVELWRAALGPADVAAYERGLAGFTLLEDPPGKNLLPLSRHAAIGYIFTPKNLAGRPGPRIETKTFRLPLPPESWRLQTSAGYLNFHLTRVGTTAIGALLDTTY